MSPLAPLLVAIAGASPDFGAAKEAYEAGQYEACAGILLDAETATEHLYGGLCQFAIGQPGEASRHFNRALELDPAAELPPFSPPKAVSFFAGVKAQRPAPRVDYATVVGRYEAGDFAAGLAQLRVLRREPVDAAREVRLRLLEGALLLGAGQGADADTAWRAALVLQPAARFDFAGRDDARVRLEGLRQPPQASPGWGRVAVPAVLGGALLVSGGVFLGLAHQGADELRAGDPTIRTSVDLARKGEAIRTQQTVGFLLGGAGVVAVGTAGVLALAGRPPPVAVFVTQDTVGLTWAGRWP